MEFLETFVKLRDELRNSLNIYHIYRMKDNGDRFASAIQLKLYWEQHTEYHWVGLVGKIFTGKWGVHHGFYQ